MRIALRPVPIAVLVAAAVLLDSLRALAGPTSRIAAVFVPLLVIASLAQLAATWVGLGFHQDFSTDHPTKGETVRYGMVARNGLPFRGACGLCRFAASDVASAGFEDLPIALSGHGEARRAAFAACPYRGVYRFGVRSFLFRDSLGLVEIEAVVEPRIFHVFPELVALGPGVERLAEARGDGRIGSSCGEADPTVFDGLRPLRDGEGARRVSWRRWAATGVPCAFDSGRSAAYGLRVVLDLRPCGAEGDERLQAEDLAATAAYSVLRRAVEAGVPVEFVLGGDEEGTSVESRDDFDAVYGLSVNALFTDERFPASAFRGDRASLLVTTRPIAQASAGTEGDLFSSLERCAVDGAPAAALFVPPRSAFRAEADRVRAAAERLGSRVPLLRALDPEAGAQDLIHAFAS